MLIFIFNLQPEDAETHVFDKKKSFLKVHLLASLYVHYFLV